MGGRTGRGESAVPSLGRSSSTLSRRSGRQSSTGGRCSGRAGVVFSTRAGAARREVRHRPGIHRDICAVWACYSQYDCRNIAVESEHTDREDTSCTERDGSWRIHWYPKRRQRSSGGKSGGPFARSDGAPGPGRRCEKAALVWVPCAWWQPWPGSLCGRGSP